MNKQAIIDWYNRKIIAGWYRSAAIRAGWITSGILFVPDILQFAIDHWDILGGFVLPTSSNETKALVLGLFTTFVLPPLRAWQQQKMREAALKQAVETGAVTSAADTAEVQVNVGSKP